MPSYRKLLAHDVEEKSPGEFVTIIDRQAEGEIVARLKRLAPDIVPIGEEGVAINSSLLDAFHSGQFSRCWLIDPLDGTGNFIDGDDRFAVMVTLIDKGQAVCSWIYEPATDRLAVAELGSGAYLEGRKLAVDTHSPQTQLKGSILSRFLPSEVYAQICRASGHYTAVPGSKCAGYDYPTLANTHQHFNLYWRMLPWDHAAGALLLTEAGGCVRYFDEQPYSPMSKRSGAIAAINDEVWAQTKRLLLETP